MHNNKVFADPKTIADGFNNYFVNTGPTLASKIPDNNVSHGQFLSDNIKTSLFLKPTNEIEIKQVISCLKEEAPGRDGLSSKNVKCIKDFISCPLTNIVKLSFEPGVFPNELELQFGFRNNHSTFMALVVLIEDLVNALDSGICAVGIFLDFQKAFDTADHCILLDKLYCYAIRGTAHEWFVSYLSSCQQSVMYTPVQK